MQEFDIPIFKKTYELYKQFHTIRNKATKQDRFTICLKTENALLDVIEGILEASELYKNEKMPVLRKTSRKLNLLRVFVQLIKDTGSIELKNYAMLEEKIDEIGRMLGGWIKSIKET